MTVFCPQRHTSIIISEILVNFGSLSQLGPRMPNQDKKLFSRPYSGLSTHKNSMALATMGTTVAR